MNPKILGNLDQRHTLPTSQSHPDHILTKLSSIPLRHNNSSTGQHLTYQPHQLSPNNAADPIEFFFAECDSYNQNLTDEQFQRTYMDKDLYERVPDAALTSDCPATTRADPDDPLMSIQAAVERKA